MTESDLAKALAKMRARTEISESGCWLFAGAKNGWGYGNVRIGGTVMHAHRISYLAHHGQLEPGMVVRHKCDTPPCWNPEHLEKGTNSENIRDVIDRQRDRDRRFRNLVGGGLSEYFTEEELAVGRAMIEEAIPF